MSLNLLLDQNQFFFFRQELLDRRSARHLRKQQLAKRRTAASQVQITNIIKYLDLTQHPLWQTHF
jgi:hypothetical protein